MILLSTNIFKLKTLFDKFPLNPPNRIQIQIYISRTSIEWTIFSEPHTRKRNPSYIYFVHIKISLNTYNLFILVQGTYILYELFTIYFITNFLGKHYTHVKITIAIYNYNKWYPDSKYIVKICCLINYGPKRFSGVRNYL